MSREVKISYCKYCGEKINGPTPICSGCYHKRPLVKKLVNLCAQIKGLLEERGLKGVQEDSNRD